MTIERLVRMALACAALATGATPIARAQEAPIAPLPVLYLTQSAEPDPLMLDVAVPPPDEGLPGARLAVQDNESVARFMPAAKRVRFQLVERVIEADADFLTEARAALAGDARFVVADLPAARLVALQDLAEAKGKLIFNIAAPDTRLREDACRADVLHVAPSYDMLADALFQFLTRKRWTRIFLLSGERENDKLYAQAVRNAAKKFQAKIVADKEWKEESELRRGMGQDANALTQGADYDVLVVADVAQHFGENVVYNTFLPRPVVGTQGMSPIVWSRIFDQWGATQLQQRFEKLAGRPMRGKDWAAWIAMRTLGEAGAKTGSGDPAVLRAYATSGQMRLDGFKGRSLDYRPWNGQMRQPIFLAQPNAVVSVSPQEGFLHPLTDLDTLGLDAPESKCKK